MNTSALNSESERTDSLPGYRELEDAGATPRDLGPFKAESVM